MKVAITGASGFIGYEVIQSIRNCSGIEIVALTRNCKEGKSDQAMGMPVIWKNTDYSVESLKSILSCVDVVVHLAAVRGTEGSISSYHVNEVITENVLLAMAEAGVSKIIYVSSIAVYSEIDWIPWRETDVLSPKTLYGITKAACEHLCEYYAKKAGYICVILRLAQVLGENETHRGMMNKFIDQAAKGGQLVVHGRSIAKRQFIYVRDLADIIVRLIKEKMSQSMIMNVGMESAYSNLQIAQTVNRVFENTTNILYEDDCAENVESSCMDISKCKEYLGMPPRNMEHALRDIRRRMANVSECDKKDI